MYWSAARRASRRGFTLVELLVVIAIIGVLVALLLPAVQAAREAARRMQCGNNLKQQGLTIHLFEQTFTVLPRAKFGTPPTGCFITLLPFMEQKNIYDLYNINESYTSTTNSAVLKNKIATFKCPSAPTGNAIQSPIGGGAATPFTYPAGEGAATTDYQVLLKHYNNIGPTGDPGGLGPLFAGPSGGTAEVAGFQPTFAMTTDGTSNTAVIAEQGARHQLWVKGKMIADPNTDNPRAVASWGGQNVLFWGSYNADGYGAGGANTPLASGMGPCVINCNNSRNAYGFHPGIAQFAMLDGSVRGISQSIDGMTLFAICARSDGQIVTVP